MSVEPLKVVPLRPADHIPEMLRQMADNIESGATPAEEVLCILRSGVNSVGVSAWGEYRGNIAALGVLEAAKRYIETGNIFSE